MPRINVNNTTLYYELLGPEDGEVIVLSNGILMSTASWGFQKAALSRKNRLLLYDCRGMWQSDHPAGPYSMEQHADDLAALLTALNIQRAHIAGISYGGEVSIAFALKYPERAQTLIVSSSVTHSDAVLNGVIASWRAATLARDPELLFKVSAPFNFSDAWMNANQAAINAAAKRYVDLDFTALLELIDAFNRMNLTPQLRHITTPTLVMVGEEDILKPRKYSQIISSQIPGASLVVVPNAGHALCMEQPGVFNTLVLGFVHQHPIQ